MSKCLILFTKVNIWELEFLIRKLASTSHCCSYLCSLFWISVPLIRSTFCLHEQGFKMTAMSACWGVSCGNNWKRAGSQNPDSTRLDGQTTVQYVGTPSFHERSSGQLTFTRLNPFLYATLANIDINSMLTWWSRSMFQWGEFSGWEVWKGFCFEVLW